MRTRSPLAAALAHAVLLGTVALPPMLAPVGTVAQAPQASQPERTVFGIRFLGEWVDDHDLRYVFTDAGGGKLKGVVTRPSTGETVATMDWEPRPEGMGGPFRVPGQNPADPSSDRGITGYVDHEGGANLYVRSGRFANGHQAQAHPDKGGSRPYNFSLKRPAGARAANERAWMGQWRTNRGLLELRNDGHGMFGVIRSGEPASPTARVALRGDTGGIAFGAWEKEGAWTSTVDRGDLWLQQSADGKSFRGYYTEVNGSGSRRMEWTGERVEGRGSGADPEEKVCGFDSSELQSAGGLLAKLDIARGEIRGDLAEFSVKVLAVNPSNQARTLNPRNYTARVVEADGQAQTAISYYNSVTDEEVFFERTVSRCEIFGPTIRFRKLPTQPNKRLVLMVEGRPTASWDISNYFPPETTPQSPEPAREPVISRPPAPNPPSRPAPPPPPADTAAGFAPLEKWDVRVDRVENPRDDRLTHVYLTLRNSGTGNLVQTQGVSVRHEDGDGVVTESGQGLRAKPGRPELFGSPPPIVLPGREIKTKFVFDRSGGTSRITVVEGQATADFDF